ncbi:hypothetical protein FGO68_gene6613 [Halteria grandinella]|uniref:Uncharacterized protein n=1 Tax=Halteria grandinella TaxID=5974 RepID=A0A8J8T585_HALGN|nr:hypothetical protein FGO68_gene6613 [Halteria grandinella]
MKGYKKNSDQQIQKIVNKIESHCINSPHKKQIDRNIDNNSSNFIESLIQTEQQTEQKSNCHILEFEMSNGFQREFEQVCPQINQKNISCLDQKREATFRQSSSQANMNTKPSLFTRVKTAKKTTQKNKAAHSKIRCRSEFQNALHMIEEESSEYSCSSSLFPPSERKMSEISSIYKKECSAGGNFDHEYEKANLSLKIKTDELFAQIPDEYEGLEICSIKCNQTESPYLLEEKIRKGQFQRGMMKDA